MREIRAKSVDAGANIAIIVSDFNPTITEALKTGAVERLTELGIQSQALTVVHVPGAVEIPLVASRLAQTEKYNAIITLGVVVRGETSHYDSVCEQVSLGCQQVMLDYNVPVVFGVLTTENQAQAQDRVGGKKGHKGRDAADAAIAMISVLQQI